MSKKRKSPKPANPGLVDPTRLKPFTKKGDETTSGVAKSSDKLLQVIIETPKGSHNKYSFDDLQKIFVLKASLPAGMVFPYDFGFLPRTLADDGDPIDVLVLMDEPAFTGCALMARLIGVIEGEQTDGKKTNRNDRLVAVADTAHMWANVKSIKDLPKKSVKEIQDFFVNYHKLEGKKYKLLAVKGEKSALTLITKARKKA